MPLCTFIFLTICTFSTPTVRSTLATPPTSHPTTPIATPVIQRNNLTTTTEIVSSSNTVSRVNTVQRIDTISRSNTAPPSRTNTITRVDTVSCTTTLTRIATANNNVEERSNDEDPVNEESTPELNNSPTEETAITAINAIVHQSVPEVRGLPLNPNGFLQTEVEAPTLEKALFPATCVLCPKGQKPKKSRWAYLRHLPCCLRRYLAQVPNVKFEAIYNRFAPQVINGTITAANVIDLLRDDFLNGIRRCGWENLSSNTFYTCQIDTCNYKCLDIADMEQHQVSHCNRESIGERGSTCHRCKEVFTSKSNCTAHLNRKFPCSSKN